MADPWFRRVPPGYSLAAVALCVILLAQIDASQYFDRLDTLSQTTKSIVKDFKQVNDFVHQPVGCYYSRGTPFVNVPPSVFASNPKVKALEAYRKAVFDAAHNADEAIPAIDSEISSRFSQTPWDIYATPWNLSRYSQLKRQISSDVSYIKGQLNDHSCQ